MYIVDRVGGLAVVCMGVDEVSGVWSGGWIFSSSSCRAVTEREFPPSSRHRAVVQQ